MEGEALYTEKYGLMAMDDMTYDSLWFADEVNPNLMWHWIQWRRKDTGEVVRVDKHGKFLKGLEIGAETTKVG